MNEEQVMTTPTISGTDETTPNLINVSSTADVFVKRTSIKPSGGENGAVQRDRCHSTGNAWEDEEVIIQSCLIRSLHNSRNTLSNYPLTKEEQTLAKKKTIKLWNTVFSFLSNTSFHGLPHIVSSKRSQCRLIFWTIVILISLGLMLWAVVSVTIQYAEKNTVLFSKHHFNNRLQFPAITICNKNLHRKSVARNTRVRDDVLLASLTDLLLAGDSLFSNILHINSSNPQYENLSSIIDNEPTFYYNNSGHQISEMLIYCQYAMRNCSTDNFIQRTSTSGNCYTFNSGQNGSAVLYSVEGGYRFGLEMILNAEQYEYFLPDSDSVGFNVFIHDQDHFPHYGGVNSFSVSPGQLTQVALHKVDYKLQKPAGGGQCDDSITLKYYKSYSHSSCIVECVTDLIVGTCNCKYQGFPGPAQVCKLRDACFGRLVAQGIDLEQCNCPIACEMTVYEKTLSYARFPADHISLLLNNSEILSTYPFPDFILSTVTDNDGRKVYLNDNFTESFLSNNFAKVFIYYEDLVSTSMEEGLEYSTFQFIADFGGHIGLFTGAGFLTLFEIIDLCYSMIRPIDD